MAGHSPTNSPQWLHAQVKPSVVFAGAASYLHQYTCPPWFRRSNDCTGCLSL